MSSYLEPAIPYNDGEDTIDCPECKKRSKYTAVKQKGHNEPEDINCAHCKAIIGKARASLPIKTYKA